MSSEKTVAQGFPFAEGATVWLSPSDLARRLNCAIEFVFLPDQPTETLAAPSPGTVQLRTKGGRETLFVVTDTNFDRYRLAAELMDLEADPECPCRYLSRG